jgi:hypothetical protein
MKMKTGVALVIAIAFGLFAASCKKEEQPPKPAVPPAATAPSGGMPMTVEGGMPTTAATHYCPMHPGVRGKAGDKCPKCNMPLEPMPPGHRH